MPSKLPPPPIALETMQALIQAATAFGAAKPWEKMFDTHLVGLTDPVTNDLRLASVMGNAGQVFGASISRRAAGFRCLLQIIDDVGELPDMEIAANMDGLKLEFVARHELTKEEVSRLKAHKFQPVGSGRIWPQFQSVVPGWAPWYIDETEARQLAADLPRIVQFYTLFRAHPDLYDDHDFPEVPFLPEPMPGRPLTPDDLDWRALTVPPETHAPYQPGDEQWPALRALKPDGQLECEFGCEVLSSSLILEQGKPCHSRVALLLDHQQNLVLGVQNVFAFQPLARSAGEKLVAMLLQLGRRPRALFVADARLVPILAPLCLELLHKY